jgi:glycosyltransferase involved in cell wall biosynthesis
VWTRVGGFDETMRAGGDEVEFALQAHRLGIPFLWVPDAVVHYRLRHGVRARFTQQRRWGWGNHRLYDQFPEEFFGPPPWDHRPPVRLLGRAAKHLVVKRDPVHTTRAVDAVAEHLGSLEYERDRRRGRIPPPRGGRRHSAAGHDGEAGPGEVARVVLRPATFASSFHPHLGGVEELVRQLAHAQRRAGLVPVVHTMRWPRSLPAREVVEGIDVRRHSYRSPDMGLRRTATAAVGNPAVLADVVAQLRLDRTDLVHVQCVHHGAWFALQAARACGLPFVATLQGELTMDAEGIYDRSPALRHTLRRVLRHADAVTACSAATLAEAEAWADIELGRRGHVIPNGIALAELTGPEGTAPLTGLDGPYVAALGRHVHQKGFDVLIDAFAKAAGRLPAGWRLAIAGEGEATASLRALVSASGLDDRVVLTGRLQRTEVVRLLRHASAFVLPSRHEPFGIVNLEAMAAGAPVVATAVGGVPELVHDGDNGLLVEPEDPGALADAIVRVATDPRLADRLRAGGRRTAAAHDWSAIEARYAHVHVEALARHRLKAGLLGRR